ncbi:SapC family protein [soil metagenome]
MATAPVAPPEGEISGNVLLYVHPEPLNKEVHGKLGLEPTDAPYGFAKAANACPLHVSEFGIGAASFPIIFAGETRQPLAVMALRENENLFIDEKGGWEPGAYIPSFVRRYPFVLANDDAQQRLVVCIDVKAPFLKEGGQIARFENDEASAYTKNALQFCQDFETERQRTESFVKLLTDLDLLETKQTHYAPPNADGTAGDPIVVSEYFAVSEEKLGALPAAKLKELQDNGALPQIYAHLVSLAAWDKLLARTLAIAPLTPATPTAANA